MQMDLLAELRRGLGDRYAVAGEIGRGGMAVVCRARDLRHDRDVAIKLLYPELARAVTGERFLREIAILGKLSHPHILPLLDSGTLEVAPGLDVPWYTMPLASEESLRSRLEREGPLPVEVATGIARDICAALEHAHARGFVHRDIKPENILLSGNSAILADFGIARAVSVAGGDTLTSTGLVVGTPAYMSPEQSAGGERVDGRSDLYSLGVVLYEMLAGHPPFTGATPQAISARHLLEPPPPIRVVRPAVPEGLARVLEQVLAKVPGDRPQTAADVHQRLGELAYHPPTKARRSLRRTWAMATGLLLLAAATATAKAWLDAPLPADPERLTVLPFEDSRSASAGLLQGVDCMLLVYDALGHWPDLPQVDPMRVQDALATAGVPRTLSAGEHLARQLGAGQFIWGQVYLAGDTVRVRSVLYQLQRIGSTTLADTLIDLPATAAGGEERLGNLVVSAFLQMTRQLLTLRHLEPLDASMAVATTRWGALREALSGDSALQSWNLSLARQHYRAALSQDPGYAKAHLGLARLGLLSGDEPPAWHAAALRAMEGSAGLAPHQQQLAEALEALADYRYPEACARLRSLAAADSTDFFSWFGLGECLYRDDGLVRAASSPSGFVFRSEYRDALDAYDRALRLVPLSHSAFAGAAITRLIDRYYAEPNTLRWGRWSPTPGDTTDFAAFPTLINDTLGFLPRPAAQVLNGQWVAEHNTMANAIGRQRLVDVTSAWAESFPHSASAWRAHAIALELAGSLDRKGPLALSALEAIQRSRGLGAGPAESLELGIVNVRLLVKLWRFREAASLSDSILDRVIPATAQESAQLAALAALRGQVDKAADFLARSGTPESFATPDGATVRLSPEEARLALALLAYASFGGPPDSLSSLNHRLQDRLHSHPGATPSSTLIEAVMDRPTLLAFPAFGPPRAGGSLRDAERALARHDTAVARAALDSLAAHKQGLRPGDFAIDMTLLEARLRVAAGDRPGAKRLIGRALGNLDGFGLDLVQEVPQAAAVGRLLVLADSLGTTSPPRDVAADARALWAH